MNSHWTAKFDNLPRHPITRGVMPFAIEGELYYHMRFREGMRDVTPILTALPPTPDEKQPAKFECEAIRKQFNLQKD